MRSASQVDVRAFAVQVLLVLLFGTCVIFPVGARAQVFNPGATMDPSCSPSVLCTVYLGITVGTTTASSTLANALLYTDAGGVIDQSAGLQFVNDYQLLLDALLTLPSTTTPAVTANTLYNTSGTLFFNGLSIGTVGTTVPAVANRVAFWGSATGLASDPDFIYDPSSYGFFGIGQSAPVDLVHLYYPVGGPANIGLTITGAGNGVATSTPAVTLSNGATSTVFAQLTDRFRVSTNASRIQWSSTLGVPRISFNVDGGPSYFGTPFAANSTGGLLIASSSPCIPGCTNPTLQNALTIYSNGTAALPAIALGDTLDTNTGFFRPAQDVGPFAGTFLDMFAISTNGIERMRFGTTSNAMGGNVSIGTTLLNDDGTTATEGRYDALIVGGTPGNAGITILADVDAKIQLGRWSVGSPNSYVMLGTTSARFTYRNNADDENLMHLTNNGMLLVGANLGDTEDAQARVHAKSDQGSTTPVWRNENYAIASNMFVTQGTPNNSLVGSTGDLAFDETQGQLYIKRAGIATNVDWVPYTIEATTTCEVTHNRVCVGGNTLGTTLIIGRNNATTSTSTFFEINGTNRAALSARGDFSLGITGNSQRFQIGGAGMLSHRGVASRLLMGVGAGAAAGGAAPSAVTYLGFNAGTSHTAGTSNVALGALAFDAAGGIGSNVTAVGVNALGVQTVGTGGVALGNDTFASLAVLSPSVAIGDGALQSFNAGGQNPLAIGTNALTSATSPANSMAIGTNALAAFVSGVSNLVIGNNALSVATSTINHIAIGDNALRNTEVTLVANLAIGSNALFSNVYGFNNVAIGDRALYNNNAVGNVAIGTQALFNNTVGTSSLAIGYQALFDNVSGYRNTAIGRQALASTTANNNVGLGTQALYLNTTGEGNIAIGTLALPQNTIGNHNIAIGNNTLSQTSSGSYNIAIGDNALRDNLADFLVAIGTNALMSNTTGAENIALGHQVLMNNTTGEGNIGIGTHALILSNGSRNIAIGSSTLESLVSGDNNIALGENVLRMSTASDNIGIGYGALELTTTGTLNIALGMHALRSNTTGSENIAIGLKALESLSNSDGNIAIGAYTLQSLVTGVDNIAIGTNVLKLSTVDNNIGIGSEALAGNTTGQANIALGIQTLMSNQTGWGNIAIGSSTLMFATSSSYNIALGSGIGSTSVLSLGSGNIVIGNNATTTTNATTDYISIGQVLYGYTSSSTNPSIGIRNNNPQRTLHVGSTTVADGTALMRTQDSNSSCDFSAQGAAIACGSDRRLKKNIENSPFGLDELLQLRPVQFHWNSELFTEQKHTGFIAQEVDTVFPEFVSEREDGIKLLTTIGMIPVMVRSLADVYDRVERVRETLESRIARDVSAHSYTANTLHVDGHIGMSEAQGGRAIVAQGETRIVVTLDEPLMTAPVIVVTPADRVQGGYYVDTVTEQGFSIILHSPQEHDVLFDWRLIEQSISTTLQP